MIAVGNYVIVSPSELRNCKIVDSQRESVEIPHWFHAVEVTASGPSMRAICGTPIGANYVDVNIPWQFGHALSCRECMLKVARPSQVS